MNKKVFNVIVTFVFFTILLSGGAVVFAGHLIWDGYSY